MIATVLQRDPRGGHRLALGGLMNAIRRKPTGSEAMFPYIGRDMSVSIGGGSRKGSPGNAATRGGRL